MRFFKKTGRISYFPLPCRVYGASECDHFMWSIISGTPLIPIHFRTFVQMMVRGSRNPDTGRKSDDMRELRV
jgi:hypothetical protein